MLMVPALAGALAEQVPGVSMRFVDLVHQLLIEERTDIDFAMVPDFMAPISLIDAGCATPLFVDEFVAVVAKDHPLAKATIAERKVMTIPPSITLGTDDPLLPREVRATMPISIPGSQALAVVWHFLALPLLALLTGTVAVVPRRLIELIAPLVPLHVLDDMVPRRQVKMLLIWPKRRHDDKDHRWFCNLAAAHLRDDRFG